MHVRELVCRLRGHRRYTRIESVTPHTASAAGLGFTITKQSVHCQRCRRRLM